MLLEEMTSRKQIELLGGGFFAPLLPLVPGPDRLGQMEMLTTYIRKAFGRRPRGCWIQDYAWEPGFTSSLEACGFDFTFLQERQFRMAGVDSGRPAITEDQGRSLIVFPAFDAGESFPKIVPFHEAVADLRSRHGDLPLVCIMYPGSAARELWAASGLESPDVFFERAFAALQKESLVVETTTPSRYLKATQKLNRAYFSSSASALLLEKSCPAARTEKTGNDGALEGFGSSRRILLRHEESLLLYAKMQYVRILVSQLRGDKSRKKSAQEELWKAQCGDAYWNGPSGGFFRPRLRSAAYSALILAEKTTRQRGGFSSGVTMADIDFDGEREILYQGGEFNAYVRLKGGAIFELDSLRTLTNYASVIASQDPNARRGGPRHCFQDSIAKSGGFGQEIASCREAIYGLEDSDRPAHLAVLTKTVFIRKRYTFRKVALSVTYEIANRENDTLNFRFCSELNLQAGDQPDAVGLEGQRNGTEKVELSSSNKAAASGLDLLRIENRAAGEHLELRADRPFELLALPLFQNVPANGTEAKVYQGASILVGWDLSVPPDASVKVVLNLELRP
jgi:alpha-amylase